MWKNKLREQKFAWHNSEWIALITQIPDSNKAILQEDSILISGNNRGTVNNKDSTMANHHGRLSPGLTEDSDADEDMGGRIGSTKALLVSPTGA